MSDDHETRSQGETIACPWCGHRITDLWDYEWGSRETITSDCGECSKPISISRNVSVDYRATRGVA